VGLPLAASAAAWVVFNLALFKANPLVLDASLARARSGDGTAFVVEKVGLVTARPGTAGLEFAENDLLVDESTPFGSDTAQGSAVVEASVGRAVDVRPMAMPRFGSRLIEVRGVVPMPVTFSVAGQPGAETLTVVNDSASALQGAFFLRGGRAWSLGDLPPASRRIIPLKEDASLDAKGEDAAARLTPDPRRRAFLAEAAAGPAPADGLLVSWLDGPGIRFTAPGARRDPGRPSLALLVVEAGA
jgi:hypothetical protein